MDTEKLKCRDCKPPTRFPGCHGSCKYYIEWKTLHDMYAEKERKNKKLEEFARHDKPKRRRK